MPADDALYTYLSQFTGSTSCVSGYTCQYSNDWYSQCVPGTGGGGGSPTTTAKTTARTTTTRTTTRAATTANGGNSGGSLTTVFPNSAGSTTLPTARVISGSFDGGMLKYDRSRKYTPVQSPENVTESILASVCQGQSETGESDAMFILENGATISNVLLGPGQAEGIHCRGTW